MSPEELLLDIHALEQDLLTYEVVNYIDVE